MKIVNRLIKILKDKELKLALAESVTCGLSSYNMDECSGTSEVFSGSIVCYNQEVKTGLLGIKEELIEKFTAESQDVTDAMAKSLSKLISADVFAAITGLSSSGGSESPEKPVGTIFLSVYFQKKLYQRRSIFKGDSESIVQQACAALFDFIADTIEKPS